MRLDTKSRILGLLLATLAGAILVWQFRPSKHENPARLVVSVCQTPPSGTHRMEFRNGIANSVLNVDIPEGDFVVHSSVTDMPPGSFHNASLKTGKAELQFGSGELVSSRQLKTAFPTFSEYTETRDVALRDGQVIGKDRWGRLKNGEQWRILKFDGGAEVGYLPVRPNDATILDRVIGTICLPSSLGN